MKLFSRILLSTAALAAWPTLQATAADYDPPIFVEQAPEVPVEVGSGWYLRGDVGYNVERDFKDWQRTTSDPIFTTGNFIVNGQGERFSSFSGSGAIGYHFNDFLRAEAEIGFLSSERISAVGILDDGCTGTATAVTTNFTPAGDPINPPTTTVSRATRDCAAGAEQKTEAWNGMINGYVDLGTYAGFTPYVGGGVGLAYTPYKVRAAALCSAEQTTVGGGTSSTTTTFICDGQNDVTDPDVEQLGTAYKEHDFNFTYALSAGIGYAISPNATIDLGYRYVSIPDANLLTARGPEYHQVRVGLRYDLW